MIDIVALPMGLQTPSAPSVLFLTPLLWTYKLSPKVGLAVPQETATSVSSQRALLGIHNNVQVWLLDMGQIARWGSLWMAFALVSAPQFISIFAPMCILFPCLRRTKVPTLCSSFFLNFMWYVNCILGLPNFWANIHVSMSAHHVCSFLIGLPQSG